MKAKMLTGLVVLTALAGLVLANSAFATVPTTPTRNPNNGHYYELVPTNLSWTSANTAAGQRDYLSCTGHLATITSDEENTWVKDNFPGRYALGGYQTPADEQTADAGWTWVTGEPWSYTAWQAGEPNDDDGPGSEQYLQMDQVFAPIAVRGWLDVANDISRPYLVEYDGPCGARLTIAKVTYPAGGTNFSLWVEDEEEDFVDDFELDDGESWSELLDPGLVYYFGESVPDGWTLTDITCDSQNYAGFTPGNNQAELELGEGDDITCTFTNEQKGKLIVIKDTVPDGPQDFSFNLYGYDPEFHLEDQFTLDDDGADSNPLSNTYQTDLTPGNKYAVSEAGLDNWLIGIQCVSTDSSRQFPGPSFDPNNNGTGIAFDSIGIGETITCTFTNTPAFDLTIVKQSEAPGYNADVYFDGDLPDVNAGSTGDVGINGNGGSYTFQNLTPGTYSVSELVPNGWDLASVECNQESLAVQNDTVSIDLTASDQTCVFTNTPEPPPASFCPAEAEGVGTLRTDVYGTGKRGRSAKVTLPNYQDVDSLYGQLAAVDIGIMKFVRFAPKNGTLVQVNDATSPAVVPGTVRWWGADLDPAPQVRGTFYWGPRGNRSPRAFVLWPTYDTGDEQVANAFDTFDSPGNFAYYGSTPIAIQKLAIPETQADGADLTVNVALVDVNKDQRSVILTVEAGGVSESRVITVPNKKKDLNLETFVLTNVPRLTDEVTITLESPAIGGEFPFGGDSAAMIGASANYECELPAPVQ